MDNIPQIKPKERTGSNADDTKLSDTILIPKLDKFAKDSKISEESNDKVVSQKPKKVKNISKRKKITLSILGALLTILLVMVLLTFRVFRNVMRVKASVYELKDALTSQNLPLVKDKINQNQIELSRLKSSYKAISWLKIIPFAGRYVSDAGHGINAAKEGLDAADIVVTTIEPYADIIGFNNSEEPLSGTETAQDRIDFIIKTIPDLTPKADDLIAKVKIIKKEIDYIDPERYPNKLASYEVRSNLEKGIQLVDTVAETIINGKPLLEVAPYILGSTEEREYLIIFQNDKELRPTGGFITAYSIAKVNNGRFEPVVSSDIYNLDDNYTPTIKAAEPIIKYIKGPYILSPNYRLRDMNWSVDFSDSMNTFLSEAEKAGIDTVDGIIAVDTQLLVNILNAIGPIEVPGYGQFSTEIVEECDCPQVIYELESFADVEGPVVWSENEPGKIVFAPANYDNRKKIIGPLMNSILSNTLGQPKEKMPALFEAAFNSVNEKHVLLYMRDEKAQDALVKFGIAGTLKSDFVGDYLYINDANLGGRKSNLYVTQEVDQQIDVKKDGSVQKTLTITYKNPASYDGWLNSVLPNYVRIYVPKGSELLDISGLEDKQNPYEEYGKTVFAGFFELRPQGVAKVTLTYTLPYKITDSYQIFIQKQPGTGGHLYSLNVGKNLDEFYLTTDKEVDYKVN
jgi:hypothetical protein